MALLFTVEDGKVRPTIEVLLISPFKEIWERDESNRRMVAIDEFSYIEFMTSQKKTNPYKGYDSEKKHTAVKKAVFGAESDWEPDELVQVGLELVIQFQTEASSTYGYLMDSRLAAEKVRGFFRSFDMESVNLKTGAPIYKPKDITNALKDSDDVITKLDKLEKKVEEELFDKTVTKANKQVSPFADPNSM